MGYQVVRDGDFSNAIADNTNNFDTVVIVSGNCAPETGGDSEIFKQTTHSD